MGEKSIFQSPSKGELTVNEMISEISRFVKEEPDSYYRLIIGSDSQIHRLSDLEYCDFVTAIVVHRIGAGARYFWNKEKMNRAPVLREKIYTETMRSLDTAHLLLPDIIKSISPAKYDLEIHIDVGNVGKTREMIREVVGMVAGSGFTAKTKPDSWAASSVADKYT